MTLKDARESYYTFSGKLSDVVRQLSLAGIGVVWILGIGKDTGTFKFEAPMAHALSAFVFALLFDVLQYVIASAIWGLFARHQEKKGVKDSEDVHPSKFLNWPAIGCFWLKTICCLVGSWVLLRYLGKQF